MKVVLDLPYPTPDAQFRAGLVDWGGRPVCAVLQTGGEPGAFRSRPTDVAMFLASGFDRSLEELDFILIEQIPTDDGISKLIRCFTAKRQAVPARSKPGQELKLFRFDLCFSIPESVEREIAQLVQGATSPKAVV